MWYLEFEWYAVFPIGLSLYLYYNFALKFIAKFIRWLVKAYSHLIMRKTHYSVSSEVPALEDQLINFTNFLWSFNLHISKLFYYIVTWFYTTNKNPGGIKWAMFLKDCKDLNKKVEEKQFFPLRILHLIVGLKFVKSMIS